MTDEFYDLMPEETRSGVLSSMLYGSAQLLNDIREIGVDEIKSQDCDLNNLLSIAIKNNRFGTKI